MLNSRGDNIISNQYKLWGTTTFGAWKIRMKNILMHKMLWHLVSPNLPREIMEEDSTIATQQQMKASKIINLLVKDEVILHISHLDNPHEVWNVLKDFYESARTIMRFMLKNKLHKLTMQDETT
jgi:hypothetical protein